MAYSKSRSTNYTGLIQEVAIYERMHRALDSVFFFMFEINIPDFRYKS